MRRLLLLLVLSLTAVFSLRAQSQCFSSPTDPGAVNARSVWTVDSTAQTITIRTTFSKTFVDNTYGANAIGWHNGHNFNNLVGSDHLQLGLYDANGTLKLQFKMDYISASASAPSGYESLGVTGGEGQMSLGNASDVLNVTTSLDENLNTFGYVLTTNSPATDSNYTANATYPNWIYEVWYEATVDLNAFGAAGFGFPEIVSVHASPSKTGNNSEPVEPSPCPDTLQLQVQKSCSDTCTGSINLTVNFGQAPFTFAWSNNANTEDLSNLCAGTYTVTVTDANGNTKTATATVDSTNCTGGEECFSSPTDPEAVNAHTTWTIDGATQTVTIRTTFSKTFVDNTYGTNAIGWHNGHSFNNLVGSDHLQLGLHDANGALKLQFKMDYISTSASAPSGYESLGVTGGEGQMSVGDASDVLNVTTSLDENLNTFGYVLTTNSPATDSNYTANATYPNWIYEVWYEATVDLNAFGAAGFGFPEIISVHASPSKTGNNSEPVEPGRCPDTLQLQVQKSCTDTCTGSINLTVNFGQAPFTFAWSNNTNTEDISNLCAGTYTVTVTDVNGNTKTATATVDSASCNGGGEECFSSPTDPETVNAHTSWTIDGATQTVTIRTTFSKTFVDNTYGTNAIGWHNGHSFNNLVGSDHLQLGLHDANGALKLQFKMDYISASTSALSGYESLGVTGGQGQMSVGDASDVLNVTTSLDENLNTFGYVLTTNSPATDSNYTANATYPNWIYEVWYEATVDLNAFGVAGFGFPEIVSVHASPSKTGNNSELVEPGPCPCDTPNFSITGVVVPNSHCDVPDTLEFCHCDCEGSLTNLTVMYVGPNGADIMVLNGNNIIDTFSNVQFGDILFIDGTLLNDGHLPSKLYFQINGGKKTKIYTTCSKDIIGKTFGGFRVVRHTDSNGNSCDALADCVEPCPCKDEFTQFTLLYRDASGVDIQVYQDDHHHHLLATFSNVQQGDMLTLGNGTFNLPKKTYFAIAGQPDEVLETECKKMTTGQTYGSFMLIGFIDKEGSECSIISGCSGDGSIALTITGDFAPFRFEWSNGDTLQNISALCSGFYYVTVTDSNGCTLTDTFFVGCNDTCNMNISADVSGVSCNGANDGEITVVITGGTPPFTYLWSTGDTTSSLSQLPPGVLAFSVTVTDAEGCSDFINQSVIIDEPVTLTASVAVTNVRCPGASDGSIDITVTGGTAPYQYNWSNGASSVSLDSIPAGAYSVTVTDANGCTVVQDSIVLSEPIQLSLNAVTTLPLCGNNDDGVITLTASGGTPPYNFNWSNGAVIAILTHLAAGNYTVTAHDFNGCAATLSVNLQGTQGLVVAADSIQSAGCNGASTGAITLSVTGGQAPYTFEWSNGDTTQNISGLAAGNFAVTVTDANACTGTASFTVNQLQGLSLSIDIETEITCAGFGNGELCAVVSGGTQPYSYGWSNHENTQCISGLGSGNYSVTVVDVNNCSASVSGQLTAPDSLQVSATATNATCSNAGNGAIDISVTGGNAPYTYSWSNGDTTADLNNLTSGSYTVTITDSSGCSSTYTTTVVSPDTLRLNAKVSNVNCAGGADGSIDLTVSGGTAPYLYAWSNGASMEDISGLSAGTYAITVTDDNGCADSLVSIVVMENLHLSLSGTVQPVSCVSSTSGGVDLTVTGGVPPYSFQWSNGDTAQNISGLSIGIYSVSVSDANGCTGTDSFAVDELPSLTASINIASALCGTSSNAEVCVIVTGGSAPYSYHWSTGQITQCIDSLGAGSYSVTVTDANNCSASDTITLQASPEINLSTTVTPTNCFASSDGSAALTVTGGVPPYSFEWSNGAMTMDLSGVPAGSYAVTVTDSVGCMQTATAAVGEPGPLALGAVPEPASCAGASDGSIDLTAFGGTPPYSHSWSTGDTTEDIAGLTAGFYTDTILDSKGCQAILIIEVLEPLSMVVTVNITNQSGPGINDASIDITVTGGESPYTFQWSRGDTTEDVSGLAAGNYYLTVTGANGCAITDTIIIPSILRLGSFLELQVHPNPSTGLFYLYIHSGIDTRARISVMDMIGKETLLKNIALKRETNITDIDMDRFPQGTYFLKVESKDESKIIRIMKLN